ncbi:universal stress protein [Spongiactinospora sp. TRM90649]|uniref:universal stress protein n=1 Tax=Spongiactinospora sp. TRM90649 TaxID=3031114 RepID=UPI0023F73CE2|nr:universal stress protein [Spongiactinospora sp. TRM90649]MDF5754279.1 universal stress protein [Spongiactinospora sp. TRM90649]
MSSPIVVGVDGSAQAGAAVRWAAEDAVRMATRLHIVAAVDRTPYEIRRFPAEWRGPDRAVEEARAALADAEAIARGHRPLVRVTTEVCEGAPAHVLRERDGAVEIVVGSRGLGAFAGAVLGSVSSRVAGQARCPVVVVRDVERDRYYRVVVGLDDSDACEPALAYAVEQAWLRGATLHAVHAWQTPAHVISPETVIAADEIREERRRAAVQRLDVWREKYPQVEVTEEISDTHPVPALVGASATCDLLVVGSHGRGPVRSALLGSVSRAVLHHARCTVAVVRSHELDV